MKSKVKKSKVNMNPQHKSTKIRFGLIVFFFLAVWITMILTRTLGASSESGTFKEVLFEGGHHFRWVSWQGFYISWIGYILMFTYSMTGWKKISWATTKSFRMFVTSVFGLVLIGGTIVVFPSISFEPKPGLIPGGPSSSEFLGISGPSWVYNIELILVHFVLPLIVIVDYFKWEDETKEKKEYSYKFVLALITYPIIWLSFSMGMFFVDGWVPYSFMNFDIYGWMTYLLYAAIITCALILPFIMVWNEKRKKKKITLNKDNIEVVNNG